MDKILFLPLISRNIFCLTVLFWHKLYALPDDIQGNQKILHSISQYTDSKMGVIDSNAPTFSASIAVLKIAMKGQPINIIRNQFGIRSMINNLIVSESGNADLKKFLKFFEQQNTIIGLKVIDSFARKSV